MKKKILSITATVFFISLVTVLSGYNLNSAQGDEITYNPVNVYINPFRIVLNQNDDNNKSEQIVEAVIYGIDTGGCGLVKDDDGFFTADIGFYLEGEEEAADISTKLRATRYGNFQINFDRADIEDYAVSKSFEGEKDVTIRGTVASNCGLLGITGDSIVYFK